MPVQSLNSSAHTLCGQVSPSISFHPWLLTHLAGIVLVQQDVPCCEVPVHKRLLREVLHSLSYLVAEAEELCREFFVVA